MLLPRLAVIASLAASSVSALPRISVKGAKFFSNGQQFFVKGVAYQGTPADPLVDTNQCTLDAESMATLGTNSIRVYHVDPNANHDGCMSAFAAKGIYVWLDVDTFTTYIIQTNPYWQEFQFGNYTAVIDSFAHYDNLAGFWVGNEIINTADGSVAAPYIKAAVTDLKAYIASKNYGTIPIGYSAADIAQLRPELQNYLACGDDYSQSIDFYGLNAYEWCGQSTYETSGYAGLQAMAEGYSVPIFFSETGCNVGGPRTFEDQAAIFGPDMIDTWSGSIIYEWVQEENDYGLVSYPNGQIYNGAPTPIQPDFDNLAGQWKNINPTGIAEAAYTPSFSAPACPGPTNGWLINGNVPLPTLGAAMVAAEAASIKPTPSSSTVSYASISVPTDTPSSSSIVPPAPSSITIDTSEAQGGSPSTSNIPSSTSSSSPSQTSSGTVSAKSGKTSSDASPFTSLSTFSSTLYPATHDFTESMVLYTMSSGSCAVSTMTLIIPTDSKPYTYAAVTTTFLTRTTLHKAGRADVRKISATKTKYYTGASYVRLDLPTETGSTTPSPTLGSDATTPTSATPSASSSGVGSHVGVPAGIAGGALGLLVMVFL